MLRWLLVGLAWALLPVVSAVAGGSYHEKLPASPGSIEKSLESESQTNEFNEFFKANAPIGDDGRSTALDLIDDYIKIKAPTDQDLKKLTGDRRIRKYVMDAADSKMRRLEIITDDGKPSPSFNLDENLRLFNLFQVLVELESSNQGASKAKPKPYKKAALGHL